jgi:hypothetical protein
MQLITTLKKVVQFVLLSTVLSSFTFTYSALLPSGKILLTTKLINDYKDLYTLAITNDTSNQIQAWLYSDNGTEMESAFNLLQLANISSSYILPIDLESKQSTKKALVFLSTNTGLASIISLSLNDQPISFSSATEVLSLTPTTNMVYEPQIIPNSSTDDFMMLSYPSSIVLYKYTPATPSLTLLRTESFTNQTVKQILPFKGFIIAITQNNLTPPPVGYAHFIALGVNKEFATVNLSSVDGAYLTYDPVTQKTLLKTVSDSIGVEIQDAPMPYGVIGMQSTQ